MIRQLLLLQSLRNRPQAIHLHQPAVASQPRASRNGEGKPRREKGNRPRPAKVREEEGAAQQSKGENTSVNGAQPEAASRPPRQPRGPRRNGQETGLRENLAVSQMK